MRITAALTCLSALVLSSTALAAKEESQGGFLGLTAAYVQTNDADESGVAAKIVFGPNITENLALEFGFMDFGKLSYNEPDIEFPEDINDRPVFVGASRDDVTGFAGTDSTPGEATYTGPSSYHPRSILLNLRYRFRYTDSVDFFVKGGANAWMADVEKQNVTAFGDGTKVYGKGGKNETSGVELITGAGMMWNPVAGLNLRTEIESTSLDSFHVERSSFILYSLGLQYEF
jgi:hypothetical protein